jgi:riboflavin kinase/FMN adenylyltransferase
MLSPGSVAAVQVITDVDPPPWPGERTIVTIGAYDGVHLGHQAVIAEVQRLAEREGARSVVLTFDRHPATVVRPESAPQLLTSPEQRLELLAATGLDGTVVLHFDEAQSKETPESFIERVLIGGLAVKVVVVGEDFHFGSHREGNVRLLEAYGTDHDFVVDPVLLVERADGIEEPISSTAIRRALAGGEVELAARMLGRPYEVRGKVVQGDQRGRLLGFPTANVEVPNSVCLPADGVYAGWYERPDGVVHPCAINLGRRPTFYEHADHSLLEAHLLDFSADLYGEPAEVRFSHFLRSERKFDGIEAIRAQLVHDVQHARDLLEADTAT